MDAENGWVACCGPDFAPEIPPFVSLYDVISGAMVEGGYMKPPSVPLSFRRDIYPYFRRLGLTDWVAAEANLRQGWALVGNFNDPEYIAKLADPSAANKPMRERVFNQFRSPREPFTFDCQACNRR